MKKIYWKWNSKWAKVKGMYKTNGPVYDFYDYSNVHCAWPWGTSYNPIYMCLIKSLGQTHPFCSVLLMIISVLFISTVRWDCLFQMFCSVHIFCLFPVLITQGFDIILCSTCSCFFSIYLRPLLWIVVTLMKCSNWWLNNLVI